MITYEIRFTFGSRDNTVRTVNYRVAAGYTLAQVASMFSPENANPVILGITPVANRPFYA